jgi:outer membrane murein-binding lipoprotein Lpp
LIQGALIALLVFLLLLAAGCSNTEKTAQAATPAELHTRENQMQHKEQHVITNDEDSEEETAAATDAEGTETTEDDMTQQIQDLKAVCSADEAAVLLSNNLGMTENEDLEIDTTGGQVTMDGTGAYYTLVLKSKSMIESGGSGTVGIYRVYEDGTIIDEYAEGSQ